MVGALAAAFVSLVQPVAAFGLVLLAGFSHFVLKVRAFPGFSWHWEEGDAAAMVGALAAAPVS
jgi:hypothetical protein